MTVGVAVLPINGIRAADDLTHINVLRIVRFVNSINSTRISTSAAEYDMSLKTILVVLNDEKRADLLTETALDVAETHGGHLIGLYVRPAMQIYPAVGMQVSPEMYEVHDKYFKDASDEAEKRFEAAVDRRGVSGEWRSEATRGSVIADKVIEHGLQADLIITGQFDPENVGGIEHDCAERIVMESGRPVLLVPTAGSYKSIGKNIIIAWNATRESARAAFDALPFIQAAESARLVWIDSQKDEDHAGNLPGSEMAASLSRHGANVTTDALPSGGEAVSDALLNVAADHGADLLVMGAYGHSRVREFVFGGATYNVFRNMTIPVLMSH